MTYRNDVLTPGSTQRASALARAQARRRRAFIASVLVAVALLGAFVWAVIWSLSEIEVARRAPHLVLRLPDSLATGGGDSLAVGALVLAGVPLVACMRLFRDELPRWVTLAFIALWCTSTGVLAAATLYALAVR